MTATTTDAYWYTIRDTEPVSREREAELARAARAGDLEARNELVSRNLRFAMDVAKDYMHQGLTLDELVSAANEGMMIAVERFDPDRGFKFITYAVAWARQRIYAELAKARRIIRLPYSQVRDHMVCDRRAEDLSQALGRMPSAAELQAHVGLSDTRWEGARAARRTARSADAPVYSVDEDLDLLGTIPDDGPDALDCAIDHERQLQVQRLLDCLPERERTVVEMRFGLGGDEPMTLLEIGEVQGYCRENARLIERKALTRLATHARATGMVDLLREVMAP